MQKVGIEVINENRHLDTVKLLWRENSQTLGFFPEGAFEDYAAKKTILIAVDENDNCIGYLLYRISKERASITHLCVADAYRGKGIARLFVNKLVLQRYKGSSKPMRPADDTPVNNHFSGGYRHGRQNDYENQTRIDSIPAPV